MHFKLRQQQPVPFGSGVLDPYPEFGTLCKPETRTPTHPPRGNQVVTNAFGRQLLVDNIRSGQMDSSRSGQMDSGPSRRMDSRLTNKRRKKRRKKTTVVQTMTEEAVKNKYREYKMEKLTKGAIKLLKAGAEMAPIFGMRNVFNAVDYTKKDVWFEPQTEPGGRRFFAGQISDPHHIERNRRDSDEFKPMLEIVKVDFNGPNWFDFVATVTDGEDTMIMLPCARNLKIRMDFAVKWGLFSILNEKMEKGRVFRLAEYTTEMTTLPPYAFSKDDPDKDKKHHVILVEKIRMHPDLNNKEKYPDDEAKMWAIIFYVRNEYMKT